MRKIWAIAYKELYTTFTDRNLILIMIATPLGSLRFSQRAMWRVRGVVTTCPG